MTKLVGDDHWVHGPLILGPAALANQIRARFSTVKAFFDKYAQRAAAESVPPEVHRFGKHMALVLQAGTPTAWIRSGADGGDAVRLTRATDMFPTTVRLDPAAVPDARFAELPIALTIDPTFCLFDPVAFAETADDLKKRTRVRVPLKLAAGTYTVARARDIKAKRDVHEVVRLRAATSTAKLPPEPAPLAVTPAHRAVAKALKFISSEGGPLIATAKASVRQWFGVDDADGAYAYGTSPTDYDRACVARQPAETLKLGKGQALVLPGPVATAFFPTPTGGVFIRWEGADRAEDLVAALDAARGWKAIKGTLAVTGPLALFDSATDGRDLKAKDQRPVALRPGTYALASTVVAATVADGRQTREVEGSFIRLTRK